MTDEFDHIDVPAARPGEAFQDKLPTIQSDAFTEPGWVALSQLQLQPQPLVTGAAGEAPFEAEARARAGAAMAGAFVRTMRTTAELTQVQLSAASGIAQSVISDIERGAGKTGPGFETIIRLAKACGMEIGFAPAAQAVVSGAGSPMMGDPMNDPEDIFADISWVQGYENMRPALIGKGVDVVMEKGAYEIAMKTAVELGMKAVKRFSVFSIGKPAGVVHNRHKRYQRSTQQPLEMAVDAQGLFTVHRADGSELVLAPIAYREAGSD